MRERLQKVLAGAGLGSRRGAEHLIATGLVQVNGQIACVGQSVDPQVDHITVSGQLLQPRSVHRYVALNKPPGVVTSKRSTHGERTILDVVPELSDLFPVGRLDKDTGGLLLLTSDGDWSNLVTHPRYEVEKEYIVDVAGTLSEAVLQRLRDGVVLPDGTQTAPAQVRVLHGTPRTTRLSIVVIEGKKRQIRLMARAVGHPVISLHRVRVGPVSLDGLRSGQWRTLTPAEVDDVRTIAGHTPAAGSAPLRTPYRH